MPDQYLPMKTKTGRAFKMLNLVDFVFVIESQTLGMSPTTEKYAPRWLRAAQS